MKKTLILFMVLALLFTGCSKPTTSTNTTDEKVQIDDASHHYVLADLDENIVQIAKHNDALGLLKKVDDENYTFKIGDEEIPLNVTITLNNIFFNDKHILISGYSEEGFKGQLFDRNGGFIKDIVMNTEQNSEEAYGYNQIIGIHNGTILSTNGETIDEYNIENDSSKTLLNESMMSPVIYKGALYGSNATNGSILKISLDTLSKEEISIPKDTYLTIFTPTETGYVGIDYENTIHTLDKEGKLLGIESLKKMGPKKFNGFLQITSMVKAGDQYYFKTFGGSILDMGEAENISEEICSITKVDGPKPVEEQDNTITIYTRRMDYLLDMYAKEYMAKNPDKNIEIKSFDDLSDEDYLKKINTDIISGQNIDLMSFDGIPVDKLIKKGFFRSLDDALTDEEKNSYYSELLKGIQYNGKLYGLPINMSTNGLFINTENMTPSTKAYIEKPTFDNFMGLINDHQNETKLFRKLEPEAIITMLIQNQLSELVDNSNSKPLNDVLLNRVLDAYNAIQEKASDQSTGNDEFIYYGSKGNFIAEPLGNLEYFTYRKTLELMPGKYAIAPYPGNDHFSGSSQMLGILEKSQNSEAAINFLKFLSTDEKVQSSMSMMGLTSVNKNIIEASIEKLKKESQMEMSFVWPETTKYGERNFEMSSQTEEDYRLFDDINEKTINFNNFNNAILKLITKEIKHHFENQTSREELIQSLNNKLYLYYNE